MRFAILAAAATFAAAPAAAQTLTVPQSGDADFGPFGNDPTYGFTTSLLGQSFVAQNYRLQSFTFSLHNDPGATTAPTFRAYVASFDPIIGAIGNVLFTSGLLTGQAGTAFAPLTVTTNLGLVNGQSYVAYLGGVTSQSGVNYLAANTNAPYAGGVLVYELGGSVNTDDSQDLAFTAVFGPAATVPEPGTVFLVASGLAGVGLLARRRRAA